MPVFGLRASRGGGIRIMVRVIAWFIFNQLDFEQNTPFLVSSPPFPPLAGTK